MDIISQAKELLIKYGQTHINVDNLEIAKQILSIDFSQLNELYKHISCKNIIKNIDNIEPVKAINPEKIDTETLNEYVKIGENNIKAGKYAVVIMAGGQGTRLGHKGPKGTFKIELNGKKKSLFEIAIEKLKNAQKKYNVTIPCYIMTSPENNKQTVDFFEENNYFGYSKQAVKFFKQGELPLLDKKGKLILGENGLIKFASDGNGGIFSSMRKSCVIDEMKKAGIEWVFIGSIDNLLVKYIDATLLGLAINKNMKIATRTIIKNNPYEKVGVLCKKNNRVNVIEYTELPEEMRLKTNEHGELLYGESHIMCNLFHTDAIEKASTAEFIYHVAEKKTSYRNQDGEIIIPEEANCYKFEKFIFDSFGLFEEIAILRGKREQDFAPIKNAEGIDSPETAKKQYEEYMEKSV